MDIANPDPQSYEHDHDLKKQNASQNPAYRNLPIHFTCPHCEYTGYTIVEQKVTYISYVLMILSIFVFGIMISIILLPLVILLTRSYFHKCPSCFKEVGSDNKLLSVLNMKDKVVSLHVGEFGVVLSRRIILGILLTIVLIFTIYAKLQDPGHHHDGPVIEIKQTWNDYLTDCGREAQDIRDMKELEKKRRECNDKYAGKTILWTGYVIRVEDYRRSFYSFMHHAVVILLKMVPTESELFPDLLLAIDSERASEMNDLIASFDRGNEVLFNATIVNVGDHLKTTHLHLLNLTKGEGRIDVPMHVHEQGRYEDKPKFLRIALPSGDDAHGHVHDQSQNQNQNQNPDDNDNN